MARMISWLKSFFTEEDSNSDEIKSVAIERIAIDQSGSLLSLYDTSTDTITGKLHADLTGQTYNVNEPITCQLYKGRTSETQNLLRMVGIDQSLRVSILLKMIHPTGIASIIDYPHSIDKHTRFLCLRHITHIESCYGDFFESIKSHQIRQSSSSTSYVLRDIFWGVYAVVILQLPSDQQDEIDHILEEVCKNLISSKDNIDPAPTEKDLLNRIISTTVYSNIRSLTRMTTLLEVCQRIQQMKNHPEEYCRIKYHLVRIQPLNPKQQESSVVSANLNSEVIENVENKVLQQLSELKVLQRRLDYELVQLLQGKLQERLYAAQQSFSEIRQLHDNGMQGMSDLLKQLRKGDDVLKQIDNLLNSDVQATIQDYIHRLITSLDELTSKGNLIKQLQSGGFEYCDVAKLEINPDCDERTVKDILLENNPKKLIFCANDQLKQQQPDKWNKLRTKIAEKGQKDSSVTIVYADFTYSTGCLKKMQIVSSQDQTLPTRSSTSRTASMKEKSKASLPPSQPADEYINILLLGESGVGKSTFINAFANYLQFDSLQQAQSGQPSVVIPVSFLMTMNDNFDEKLIKFGETDPNENHNDIGQSVTQQCRSYVFEISYRKKLRIIDTPGFSDTRGGSQDEMNMKMIFAFINNLSHLNGVCLLLKPNVTRLYSSWFTCFLQIFQCFGENIRHQLIFCFTNARSTFYAPGDTRPLLKSLFTSSPVKNIPFEKKNTFCFDSESFRYLVALQRSLTFKEIDQIDFEKSWIQSVKESQRLRDFLCTEMRPYRQNVEWQSVQNAQCQINLRIRPILEAIRNILRNIILHQTNSSMKLNASSVDRPTVISYTLDRTLEKCGLFWIFPDYLNTVSTRSTIFCPNERKGCFCFK